MDIGKYVGGYIHIFFIYKYFLKLKISTEIVEKPEWK